MQKNLLRKDFKKVTFSCPKVCSIEKFLGAQNFVFYFFVAFKKSRAGFHHKSYAAIIFCSKFHHKLLPYSIFLNELHHIRVLILFSSMNFTTFKFIFFLACYLCCLCYFSQWISPHLNYFEAIHFVPEMCLKMIITISFFYNQNISQ